MNGEQKTSALDEPRHEESRRGSIAGAEAAGGVSGAAAGIEKGMMASGGPIAGVSMGVSPLLANVAFIDSFHGTTSSGDEPSTDSRMCTEESVERMTSSTEGMVSLSEDSSGRDTYAQAHGVKAWNVDDAVGGASAAGLPQHADTIELDESDEQMNGLLGSYREISIEEDACVEDGCPKLGSRHSAGDDTEEEVSNLSPDSAPRSPLDDNKFLEDDNGIDAKSVSCVVGNRDSIEIYEGSDEPNRRPNSLHLAPSGGCRSRRGIVSSSSPRRRAYAGEIVEKTATSHLSASAPLPETSGVQPRSSSASLSSSSELDSMFSALQGLQGLVLRDGDMVSFVAEDLQEQIKRASPVVRRGETPSFPGSRSSTPSLYKHAITPQIVPIDPSVFDNIESYVRTISSSVDTILENLTGTLHSMSSLTVDCMESYHDSVCKTCDSLDSNIKAMYQLMAKFEELGNMMRPVHRLSGQIKEIKRLMDLLEQQVAASNGS